MLKLITHEPAVIVALVLAILNTFLPLDDGQRQSVTLIVENVLLLIAGVVVRSSVTPVAKIDGGVVKR